MECEANDHTRDLREEPQFWAEARGERVDVAPLVRGEATGLDDCPEVWVAEDQLHPADRPAVGQRSAGLE